MLLIDLLVSCQLYKYYSTYVKPFIQLCYSFIGLCIKNALNEFYILEKRCVRICLNLRFSENVIEKLEMYEIITFFENQDYGLLWFL